MFSFGNAKLPKSTVIFNITPAKECRSRKLGLCQLKDSTKCYADKSERMYKNVLPYRYRQMAFYDKCTPQEFVDELEKARKKKKLLCLRLNEAGDFKHQADVDKAIEIAKLLKKKNIITYCYTSRSDLDFSKRKDLVVNGSGFMVDNSFKIVDKKYAGKGIICPMSCKLCSLCSRKKGLEILVREH